MNQIIQEFCRYCPQKIGAKQLIKQTQHYCHHTITLNYTQPILWPMSNSKPNCKIYTTNSNNYMSKVYVASPTAAKNPNQMHSITQQQNTDYLVNLHPNYANSQESRFTTTDPAKINRNDKLQTKEET